MIKFKRLIEQKLWTTRISDLSKLKNFKKVYQGAEYARMNDTDYFDIADRWYELLQLNQKERKLTDQEFSEFSEISYKLYMHAPCDW